MIIDANRAGDFTPPISGRAKEILGGIAAKKVKIVAGGKLLTELSKTKLRGLLLEWSRAGRLNRVNAGVVDAEIGRIGAFPITSNDIHVIALARVSQTRLVYTKDDDLIVDLKNLHIMTLKGKIIQPNTSINITNKLLGMYAY